MEIEDYYSQLKRIDGCPGNERLKWLQIKYSEDMLQYFIDYFASFPFQIPEICYKDEVVVSPEFFESRLKTEHFSTFKSRYERLDHLIRKAIEDFFVLHKDEICNDIAEEHDYILSKKEVNLLYKKTMLTYIKSAQDEIISLNRLDSQKQMINILSDFLHQIGEGDEEAERLLHYPISIIPLSMNHRIII